MNCNSSLYPLRERERERPTTVKKAGGRRETVRGETDAWQKVARVSDRWRKRGKDRLEGLIGEK